MSDAHRTVEEYKQLYAIKHKGGDVAAVEEVAIVKEFEREAEDEE